MPLEMNKSFSVRSYSRVAHCLISWTLSQT
jgi:hypothetical protein